MRERRAGHYWPSEAQETLLRAALLSGADAIEAWRALRPGSGRRRTWIARRGACCRSSAANLRRLGIDDPLVVRLEAIRRETAARNRRRFDAGRRLLADARRCRHRHAHGEGRRAHRGQVPGPRPPADVRPGYRRAHGAGDRRRPDACRARGGRPAPRITPGFIRMQHAADLVETGTSVRCDLHWHVYWECCGPGADDDLWAASVPLDFEGMATRTLAPADQLLAPVRARLPARPQLAAPLDPRLRCWCCGRAASTGRVCSRRRDSGGSSCARATMLAYLKRTFRAPVPDDVLTSLAASSRLASGALRVPGVQPAARGARRAAELLVQLPAAPRGRAGDVAVSDSPGTSSRRGDWDRSAEVARGALDRARGRVRAAVLGAPDPSAGTLARCACRRRSRPRAWALKTTWTISRPPHREASWCVAVLRSLTAPGIALVARGLINAAVQVGAAGRSRPRGVRPLARGGVRARGPGGAAPRRGSLLPRPAHR